MFESCQNTKKSKKTTKPNKKIYHFNFIREIIKNKEETREQLYGEIIKKNSELKSREIDVEAFEKMGELGDEKQMVIGVVAPYHCNYKVLESVADTYK